MKATTEKAWAKRIESERARLAKTRDHLDETISKLKGLRDLCDHAEELLQEARAYLSELA